MVMKAREMPFIVIVADTNGEFVSFRVAADHNTLCAILDEILASANEGPILDLEAVVVDEADLVRSQNEDPDRFRPHDAILH
jgi:hypothetical protein